MMYHGRAWSVLQEVPLDRSVGTAATSATAPRPAPSSPQESAAAPVQTPSDSSTGPGLLPPDLAGVAVLVISLLLLT